MPRPIVAYCVDFNIYQLVFKPVFLTIAPSSLLSIDEEILY